MHWVDFSSNDASQQSFIDLIIEKDREQIVDFNTRAIGTLDNVFISKYIEKQSYYKQLVNLIICQFI